MSPHRSSKATLKVGWIAKGSIPSRAAKIQERLEMVICICAYVSDKDIKELVEKDKSLDEIIEETQASTCCGKCKEYIEDIVKQ